MAKPHRYSATQVAEALTQAKGMVSVAAQLLRCSADTVQSYCKKFPTCERVKQTARTEILDEAELRLWKAIQRDEAWAISFTLKTIGRSRGYGERLDLSVSITRAAALVADQCGLSVEEVLAEATLLLKEADSDTQ